LNSTSQVNIEPHGTLYLVATPIGNLEDITHRAIRILREVDLIACEDTRHTRKLLTHYGISTPMVSYHEHNERIRAGELLRELQKGKQVAVVSDAGTTGISDPGFRLVRAAIDNDIRVTPVPGPSAAIAAVIVSGLSTGDFFFGGFLPARKNQRRARLTQLATLRSTFVLYEAPHRILNTLLDAREILGDCEAVIARELTKLHEEVLRGRISDLISQFSTREPRGEMVLVVDHRDLGTGPGAEPLRATITELVRELEFGGMDHRSALKQAAKRLGISRDEAYRRLASEREQAKRS